MTRLRVWLSRALEVIAGRRRDDRLAEEIDTHLDLLAAEHMARGLSEDEARLAARRAFGGVEPMKEAHRDQRGMPALDSLVQDVRFAVRSLRRDPGFTVSTVAVLALGIGVNNMLFTILNAHTIRGLPIRSAENVVYVTTTNAGHRTSGSRFTTSSTGGRRPAVSLRWRRSPVIRSCWRTMGVERRRSPPRSSRRRRLR